MQDRMIEEMQGDLACIEDALADHKRRKLPTELVAQEKAIAKRRAANKRARKARRS